jgi:hypothetical protein
MRCREHRRNLHSSQIDDLKDHLVKTKTPRPVATAIVPGYHRLVPPQIPNPATTVQPHPSQYRPPQEALTDKTLSAGAACTPPNLPGLQTAHNVDRPGQSRRRHAILLASPTGLSSSRYCSTSSKINGNSKRSTPRPRRRALFHRARLDKATRLMPAGTLLALDRPILSRPLTTILDHHLHSLELGSLRLNRLSSAASPTRRRPYKPTNR